MISLLYRFILHLISNCDAEKVHHTFIRMLRTLGMIARNSWGASAIRITMDCDTSPKESLQASPLQFFGLPFSNRIGLAAGLDKNAEALEGLQLLNFSFIEVGTVTPKAQTGNPKPRLFRDYSKQLIFNAMGFNNCGAEEMKAHIEQSRAYLRDGLILGINIGKNSSTPLEEAHKDYAECTQALQEYADYLTINVSSPNTQGLRGLQGVTSLSPILESVFSKTKKPVLVKLAPELSEESMAELFTTLEAQFPIAGWILTNTLQRDCPFPNSAMKTGGISGESLQSASRAALALGVKYSKKPLISSGGILSVQEAQLRIDRGASLVQIYSGLIFKGPSLIRELAQSVR